MKNLQIKMRYHICFEEYDIAIFDDRKCLFVQYGDRKWWKSKYAAIRNAKAMARYIGIPFDEGIIEHRGC